MTLRRALAIYTLLHAVLAARGDGPFSISIRVSSTPAAPPVPAGFTSFSAADTVLDILSAPTAAGGFAPRPSFVALMNLLGGGANIRLGHWWAPSAFGAHFSYNEANASNLARVAAALAAFNGTCTPMVPPLDVADGALAAATGAAFARWLPAAQFNGLETANEPDIALFRGDEPRYAATLAVWLSALEAAGVARAVHAPVLAGTSWWPAMPAFLRANAPRLRAFVQHRYGLSACSHTPPTPAALMRVVPEWTSANDTALLSSVAAAGLPFIVGEGNTVSCNGTAGLSDVFASALYAIDASLSALAAGVAAFKWHGLGDEAPAFSYQPIYYNTTRLREAGWDAAAPRPLFLGLWLFADVAPAGSAPLRAAVNATGSALLRAWALRDAAGARVRVVVLHKEDAGAGAARARVAPAAPCAPGARATLARLLPGAGGLAARAGSTYANQSFDGTADGMPVGARALEDVECAGGEYAFDLPAASAAVLEYDAAPAAAAAPSPAASAAVLENDAAPSAAQTWMCNGASVWRAAPAADGGFVLTLPDGRALTATASPTLQLAVARANGSAAQVFAFAPGPAGAPAPLVARVNGRCVSAADPIPGSPLFLLDCAGGAAAGAQRWSLDAATGSLSQAGALGAQCADVGAALNCSSPAVRGAAYCDAALAPAARAAALAAELTVYDLRQLLGGWYEVPGVPRLGIPRFGFGEALHGLGSGFACGPAFHNATYNTTGCPTSFPHATLLAATFNRTLWRLVGATISTEARAAKGPLLLYTPNINPSRDQRWGRAQEVPGECPLVNAEYAAAFVAGLQAAGESGAPLRAAATCKHWAAYDFEGRSGANDPTPTNVTRHNFNAVVSRKDLTEYFFPPFESCVKRGGAWSVMSSINAVDGTPGVANSNFTVKLLRGQWNFSGFVTSDCGTIADLVSPRKYVATPEAAVAAAVAGGTDWNCGKFYLDHIPDAVSAGLVTLDALRAQAARFMAPVFALGLADDPAASPFASWGRERIDTPAARALALDGAISGIVLLRNDAPAGAARPVLPLDLSALSAVALVGPHVNATSAFLSNYAGGTPLVEANTPFLRVLARARARGVALLSAAGVPTPSSNDTSGIGAAVAAARAADVTVAFLGSSQVLEREGLDRDRTGLEPAQAALLAALVAVGRPLVVVLVSGGAVSEAAAGAAGLVAAFYPGELGGEALAALLLGEAPFTGRLPVTVFRADWAARRAPTDMALAPHTDAATGAAVPGATYWYADDADVLFPFGRGLASTTWALAWAGAPNATVDAAAWATGAAAPAFSVTLTNAGRVAAGASVLGFISSGRAGEPRAKLYDFQRVNAVPPGGAAAATLRVGADVAALVTQDGARVLTPGTYAVSVGGDAAGGGLTGVLVVTGAPTVLAELPY